MNDPLLICATIYDKIFCLSVCLNPIFEKLRRVKFCAKQMFCIVVVWDGDIVNTDKPTDTPIVTNTIEKIYLPRLVKFLFAENTVKWP